MPLKIVFMLFLLFFKSKPKQYRLELTMLRLQHEISLRKTHALISKADFGEI